VKQRATVVCQRGPRILLVGKESARWSLPGGKADAREGLLEAALRELAEETGLRALRMRYLFNFTGVRTQHHVFAAQIDDEQTPVPGNEIARCRWVKVTDVSQYETSTCTQGIVELLSHSTLHAPFTSSRYQRAQTFIRNFCAPYSDSIFCE
jgi:8-oxo-dGTP diphosphatase